METEGVPEMLALEGKLPEPLAHAVGFSEAVKDEETDTAFDSEAITEAVFMMGDGLVKGEAETEGVRTTDGDTRAVRDGGTRLGDKQAVTDSDGESIADEEADRNAVREADTETLDESEPLFELRGELDTVAEKHADGQLDEVPLARMEPVPGPEMETRMDREYTTVGET
jgi:hypothetical protein